MTVIEKFCRILRDRSEENKSSFSVLYKNKLYGNCFSVLRQELDSMVRVIYLINIPDISQRELLVNKTLNGEKWTFINHNNKVQTITDRDMVNLASQLRGWTQNVYKFGCAFIHLSNFHSYLTEDPFSSLTDSEKEDIVNQLNNYHFAGLTKDSKMNDIIPYLPNVMDKITANFEYDICKLENNEDNNF
ncbi:hypothetical protein DF185_02200 [Marinifilum breve]|uniref:Uncharacterized protein n=1 Tax=Marinifilum breve TaxID=2184082 RepID=A0A2V4A4W2_9BACT|nr:hypothetical protein [Marinifilum breve]PXY02927.1 hypothetical protein DF185_02200 [Marinifilum breve]